LAAGPHDADFTQRVKRVIRQIRDSDADPATVLEAAQVQGVTAGDLLDKLDLLHDRVVIVENIRRETPRHRTLDPRGGGASTSQAHRRAAFRRAPERGNLLVAEAKARQTGAAAIPRTNDARNGACGRRQLTGGQGVFKSERPADGARPNR
jgi:hypothetical protein